MHAQPRFILPVLLLMALLGASCSKEEFAGSPKTDSFTANPVQVFQNQTCANSTLVKPPVDVLYLVDNSPSAAFLTDTIKQQLRQTIQLISSEFDYHVLVAPLIPGTSVYGENSLPVLANSGPMLSKGTLVSFESLNIESFFSGTAGASNEQGFNRVKTVINNYRTGTVPVFRQNAHTIVVLVSNGEDSSVYNNSNGFRLFSDPLFTTQFNDLRNLGYTTLNAKQFRFFSVAAHTVCQSGYKEARAYKQMSGQLYTEAVNRGITADQAGRATPDSYDLCTNDFANLYTGVNNSIRQEVIDHRYNFWPVTNSTDTNINTNDIQVFKVLASGSTVSIPNAAVNGWQLVPGGVQTRNTRYFPTPAGEPATGILISLNGTAEVRYPECMVVRTSSPIEEYQYVVLPTAPIESTIIIRVRGQQIPQGSVNGWTYEGFRTNQDIKVPGSSNVPTLRTGYFIKLNGTSKYVSGDTVESFYAPAPL